MSHADFNLQIYWVYVYSGAKLVGLLQNMTKTSLTQNGAFDVGAINEMDYLFRKVGREFCISLGL